MHAMNFLDRIVWVTAASIFRPNSATDDKAFRPSEIQSSAARFVLLFIIAQGLFAITLTLTNSFSLAMLLVGVILLINVLALASGEKEKHEPAGIPKGKWFGIIINFFIALTTIVVAVYIAHNFMYADATPSQEEFRNTLIGWSTHGLAVLGGLLTGWAVK